MIKLERMNTVSDTLWYEFSSSLDVFKKKRFSVRFEGLSPEETASIAAIPFAALMAPVAMAAGVELLIPSLDAEFAESLDRCAAHWQRAFPKWAVDRYRLSTKRIRNAPSANTERTAMLFSGGLDSLSTYLSNRAAKPYLFCILGADIPLSQVDFTTTCREKLFDAFAKSEDVGITYIHTDIREVVDPSKLRWASKNWYGAVQFGLLLTALTAPVSYGRYSKLIIAGCSHHPEDKAPCGGDPGIVRELRWASTRVEDDLNNVTRVQKVAILKTQPFTLQFLRVCWEQFEKINCSRCKKCLRTICELLLNNVDPNTANFDVDEKTLTGLRKKMTSEFHLFLGCDAAAINFWRDIQSSISMESLEDRFGSKEFFRWLKDFGPLKNREPKFVCRSLAMCEKARKIRPGKIGPYLKHLVSRIKKS